MVGLTHARRCSEFPLFRGRLGQTWLDSSAFFQAQSNAGKTPRAAVWGVEGGGERDSENLSLQGLCAPEEVNS